MSVLFLTG